MTENRDSFMESIHGVKDTDIGECFGVINRLPKLQVGITKEHAVPVLVAFICLYRMLSSPNTKKAPTANEYLDEVKEFHKTITILDEQMRTRADRLERDLTDRAGNWTQFAEVAGKYKEALETIMTEVGPKKKGRPFNPTSVAAIACLAELYTYFTGEEPNRSVHGENMPEEDQGKHYGPFYSFLQPCYKLTTGSEKGLINGIKKFREKPDSRGILRVLENMYPRLMIRAAFLPLAN